jgi:hypothetical protein
MLVCIEDQVQLLVAFDSETEIGSYVLARKLTRHEYHLSTGIRVLENLRAAPMLQERTRWAQAQG